MNTENAKKRLSAKIDELSSKIANLIPKAEDGKQWADICALEAERACYESLLTNLRSNLRRSYICQCGERVIPVSESISDFFF